MHLDIKNSEDWKKEERGVQVFLGILHDRIWFQNKNVIQVFVGETGSGKSYTALRFAELLDPEFDINEQLVYTAKEFIKALDHVKKGQVVIFDEAGVGVPAREWQSIQNKVFSYVLQTFRYKNLIVFLTTPSMKFIDSQVRVLIHYVDHALDIPHAKYGNKSMNVINEKKHDPVRGHVDFEKWIFYDTRTRKYIDFNPLFVNMPSKKLANEYEKISQERKEQIRIDALDKIEEIEKGVKGSIDGRTIRKLVNQVKAFARAYEILKELGWSDREIARRLGINHQTLHNWKSEWEQLLKHEELAIV